MTAAHEIVKRVESIGTDRIFSIADLNFPKEWWENVRVKLSRMAKEGTLIKLTKGKYYLPRTSILGIVPPSTETLVKDIIYNNGVLVGYLTYYSIWDSMGLTSQFSSTIIVGLNRRKDPITRDGRNIRFVLQPNEIRENNVKLLQLLDAVKYIKKIPDTTPDKTVRRLMDILRTFDKIEIEQLVDLAIKYPPRVRALVGVMIDSIGYSGTAYKLKDSINPLSVFKVGIDKTTFLTKYNWNVV